MVCIANHLEFQTSLNTMDRKQQMTGLTIAYGITVGLVGWLANGSVAIVAAIGAIIVGLGWAFYARDTDTN